MILPPEYCTYFTEDARAVLHVSIISYTNWGVNRKKRPAQIRAGLIPFSLSLSADKHKGNMQEPALRFPGQYNRSSPASHR